MYSRYECLCVHNVMCSLMKSCFSLLPFLLHLLHFRGLVEKIKLNICCGKIKQSHSSLKHVMYFLMLILILLYNHVFRLQVGFCLWSLNSEPQLDNPSCYFVTSCDN
jgi:hypothetical protein